MVHAHQANHTLVVSSRPHGSLPAGTTLSPKPALVPPSMLVHAYASPRATSLVSVPEMPTRTFAGNELDMTALQALGLLKHHAAHKTTATPGTTVVHARVNGQAPSGRRYMVPGWAMMPQQELIHAEQRRIDLGSFAWVPLPRDLRETSDDSHTQAAATLVRLDGDYAYASTA